MKLTNQSKSARLLITRVQVQKWQLKLVMENLKGLKNVTIVEDITIAAVVVGTVRVVLQIQLVQEELVQYQPAVYVQVENM